MIAKVESLSKRFNYQFIFKDFNATFEASKSYAILGHNGSGKSTLLKTLIHFFSPSDGQIEWLAQGKKVHPDQLYQYISITAPYVDLIEELSLKEFLHFHFKFKTSIYTIDEVIQKIGMEKHQNKLLSLFSSGMKQRVKLALTFYSQQAVWILDEPTMNLDEAGVEWYLEQIQSYGKDKLIIVASNDEREYGFCDQVIQIENYKS